MSVIRRAARALPSPVKTALRGAFGRAAPAHAGPRTAAAFRADALPNLSPIPFARVADAPATVTMITDTVKPAYLFGGVGTALLFVVTLARARGMKLRIVTRDDAPQEGPLRDLLALYGHGFDGAIDLMLSGYGDPTPVPLGDDDIVVTTSWWTTRAALATLPSSRILYLIQEDERMFYPGGDQRLMCDELLQDTALTYVVNTSLLLEHFRADGAAGPAAQGYAFEPAFPHAIYRPDPHAGRRNFVFYARPRHPRNLFLRGMEAIEAALAQGLLPAEDWQIHFAGVGIPEIDLGGREIVYHDTLPWPEYAALIRRADLGLSLMYTPHPSYPPLDLAASGAVVVTNGFGVKTDLSRYCDNILTVPTSVAGLVDGIARGAALACDAETRTRNFATSAIGRLWEHNLRAVVDRLPSELGRHVD